MMIIENSFLQGSDAWFQARIGNPGASSFSRIVTTTGELSKSRTEYLYELAGEILTQKKTKGYSNAHMEEGLIAEDESRTLYELIYGVEVTQVALCYKDEQKAYHYSPDGLILEKNRGFETKNAIPKIQVARLLKGTLPTEHFTQCQGGLHVAELETLDFQSYCSGLPPLMIRVERNEKFIDKLNVALNDFSMELAILVNKLKAM